MTREYLDHIKPVAVNAAVWAKLIFSTGLAKSLKPAITSDLNLGSANGLRESN